MESMSAGNLGQEFPVVDVNVRFAGDGWRWMGGDGWVSIRVL
jgi:hypothetical protein